MRYPSHINHPHHRALLSFVLTALLAPFTVRAQTPPAPSPPEGILAFAETIDVRVVHLEVVVARRGERLRGLAPEDFVLEVDGDVVPIEYFTEVAEGRGRVADSVEAVPGLAPGEAVATRYLVFIDDSFAVARDRDRVLRALVERLDLLGRQDEMAIVAFDGRRIDLLTPWTSSRPELLAALEQASERTAYGLRRFSELRRFNSSLPFVGRSGKEAPRTSFSGVGFLGSGREAAVSRSMPEFRTRVNDIILATASAMLGLDQGAGRRVMLMLSGGWPALGRGTTEGSSTLGPWGQPQKERFKIFDPLVGTANRLGYTLYPIDCRPLSSRGRTTRHGESRWQEDVAVETRAVLFYLAESTGGRALQGAESMQALEKVVEDTRTYYWLGFSPEWRGDDETHRLRLSVKRRGFTTRGRESFSDLSRAREVDLMVEGAQLLEAALPGAGDVSASLGEPRPNGRRRVLVPLRLAIPLDKLTLLPGPDGYSTTLELRVAARDEDGSTAEIPIRPITVTRVEAPGAGEVEVYETELELRAKDHRLLIALFEPATGNLLARRLRLEL